MNKDKSRHVTVGRTSTEMATRMEDKPYPRCPSCGCWDCYPTDEHECTCPECGTLFEVDPETDICTVLDGIVWSERRDRRRYDSPLGSIGELIKWLAAVVVIVSITTIVLTYI